MPNPLLPVRESKVEKCLTNGLKAVRVESTKPKTKDWPDRIIPWFDGIVDFVELKKPKGGVFTSGQLRIHERLRLRGHNVYCLFTETEVREYLEMRAPHGRPIGVRIEAPKYDQVPKPRPRSTQR